MKKDLKSKVLFALYISIVTIILFIINFIVLPSSLKIVKPTNLSISGSDFDVFVRLITCIVGVINLLFIFFIYFFDIRRSNKRNNDRLLLEKKTYWYNVMIVDRNIKYLDQYLATCEKICDRFCEEYIETTQTKDLLRELDTPKDKLHRNLIAMINIVDNNSAELLSNIEEGFQDSFTNNICRLCVLNKSDKKIDTSKLTDMITKFNNDFYAELYSCKQ